MKKIYLLVLLLFFIFTIAYAQDSVITANIMGFIDEVEGVVMDLNVGTSDGIVSGMTGTLLDGNTEIGTVVVQSAGDKTCKTRLAKINAGKEMSFDFQVKFGLNDTANTKIKDTEDKKLPAAPVSVLSDTTSHDEENEKLKAEIENLKKSQDELNAKLETLSAQMTSISKMPPTLPDLVDKTVVILPVENLTANIPASDFLYSYVSQIFSQKGYTVLPEKNVLDYLYHHGFSDKFSLTGNEIQALGAALKASYVVKIRLSESLTLAYSHPVLFFSSRRMARTTLAVSLYDVRQGKTIFEKQASRLAGSSAVLNFLQLRLIDILIYPSKKLRASSLTGTIKALTGDLTTILP